MIDAYQNLHGNEHVTDFGSRNTVLHSQFMDEISVWNFGAYIKYLL